MVSFFELALYTLASTAALSSATPIRRAPTHIHVNKGCILINNYGVCAPDYTGIVNGKATIYAGYDNSKPQGDTAIATLKLDAEWPIRYGDVYYGADNCLYQGSGAGPVLNSSGKPFCAVKVSVRTKNPY